MEKKKVEVSRIEALAKYLDVDAEDIEDTKLDVNSFYAGCSGKLNSSRKEYLVLTDEEADEAVKENIKESAWAFNASFILSECGLPQSGEESLRSMQNKSCEGANDFILALIEKTCGLNEFVESAVSADGRGHFLSSYDGEEGEEGDFFIYRTN